MAIKTALQEKLQALAAATREADPTAFLVEPRVIRRILREKYAYPRLLMRVPHSKVYVATYEQLRREVHIDELGLTDPSQIPLRAILIQEPTERQLERVSEDLLKRRTWRLLFHGQVDREVQLAAEEGRLGAAEIRRRIDELGQVTFDEIHTVLKRENLLLEPDARETAWCEFAAVYLEFLEFSPRSIETWFPSLRDRELPNPLPEVNADALFRQSRLPGAAEPADPADADAEDAKPDLPLEPPSDARPVYRKYRRLMRAAEKATGRGNNVRAAILFSRAISYADTDQLEDTRRAAIGEIDRIIERLRDALEFDDVDEAHWHAALTRVLPHASGGFWNSDRKLLYDLQKVCAAHERLTYKVDLVKWIASRGRRALKRPLPNQREVMMSKYLRTAKSRLPFIHLSGFHRERLSTLIRHAADSAEHQMRNRLRPIIRQSLRDVGFEPRNGPEHVAFEKVSEQSLDCIAKRGYLTMGYLRDAISRNTLKLPDISSVRQILKGDRLLKADDRFDETLDGVYHRGEFYLRWLQLVSSLAFGTKTGRFTTQYLAIPFGGAFLIVEGVNHIRHRFVEDSGNPWELPLSVFTLGLFLLALIHVREFRASVLSVTLQVLRSVRWTLLEIPLQVLRWKWVRIALRSRALRLTNRYLITPTVIVLLLAWGLPTLVGRDPPNMQIIAACIVLTSILLNSRIGRDLEEITFEWVSARWYELRAHVFVAVFEFVWEFFEKLLEFLERFLYAIDEWLRFRGGEAPFTLALKAVLGVIWSAVDFVVRFCVNLLIEPQVNPIKHFPVVTVSHKLLLPTVPVILGPILVPITGSEAAANTVAVTIATVIPGVFGFLVWELKENWRLYEANQAEYLRPVAVGSHGETMRRLLKPGFHSGTLPKLYHKLRRLDGKKPSFRRSVRQQRLYEQLHHCEDAIRHHIERELISYLRLSPEWQDDVLSIEHVDVASNSIILTLGHSDDPKNPMCIVFQEQSGWLVAGVPEAGWSGQLQGPQQNSFRAALLGFYKVGAVDMVREQIQSSLGIPDLAYDIGDHGLKVWPGQNFRMEFMYDLERRPLLTPKPASAARRLGLPVIEPEELILSEAPVEWTEWVQFWNADPTARDAETLLRGRVLIAGTGGKAAESESVSPT